MAEIETSTPRTPDAGPARTRFRWRSLLRYRLRTLLVLVTLAALCFGWLTRSARQQSEAVAVLRQARVEVVYDRKSQSLDRPAYLPEWLVEILGVDYFDSVIRIELDIFDQEAPYITDGQLKYVKNLTRLTWLDISLTPVTDDGARHLGKLTKLERLDLRNTLLTDAGLEYLKGLTNLKHLDISETEVTDAGLEHLKGLTSLEHLDLQDTQVTDTGEASLQKALPNCRIAH